MDGGAIFAVAVVAGVVVLVVFGVRAAKRAGIERNARLREMAARLGLEYIEMRPGSKYLPPEPSVSGIYAGRQARLREFSRGSGKNRTRWVAAHVACSASTSLKMTIRTQRPAILEKIAGAFGYKDIIVDDLEFDALLAINGNDETFIQAALIPEIRARIVAFWPKKLGGRIIVGDGEAVYEEQGSFGRESCREHLEKSFPVLSDMAAMAEIYRV
jgi:hypothetical protein